MPRRIVISKTGKIYEYDRQYRLQSDYLKYYRLIRYYIARRYNIATPDLELLLFLRGEKYFSQALIRKWKDVIGWERDRMSRLMQDGWVELYRKGIKGKQYAIYHVSYKAQRMMTELYDIIEMRKEAVLSHDAKSMSYKRRDKRFIDSEYIRNLKEMNKFILSKRFIPPPPHPAPESPKTSRPR